MGVCGYPNQKSLEMLMDYKERMRAVNALAVVLILFLSIIYVSLRA